MQDVILIGDSIRAGYQGEATNGLADVAYVWGPEDNCGDSANILGHLYEWVIRRPCDVLHINCGLHDLKMVRGGDGTHQIPIDHYKYNLNEIFTQLRREKPDTVLVWATITPVIDELHNVIRDFDRYQADVEAYNAAALEVVRQFDVIINDLHGLVMRTGKGVMLTEDGVHFGDSGYRILGEAVAACIHPLLPNRG